MDLFKLFSNVFPSLDKKQNEINRENEINYEKRTEGNENTSLEVNENISKISLEKREEMKNELLKSKIGLYNAGGSCYMASIIQILIHSKEFLDTFLEEKINNKNSLSYLLYKFIEEIANSNNSIEIEYFAEQYNKINYKFNGRRGNNPMTFFTEFIKQLDKEGTKVSNIFTGQKHIEFIGMPELDYDENFIFYLAVLDENKYLLYDVLYDEKEFEDDGDGGENLKLKERIIKCPKILIINVEVDDIEYKFEEKLYIEEEEYNLKAINRYTDFHSTA
jgi:hypothetical protein